MTVENKNAPRLAETETVFSYECAQCGEAVRGTVSKPAKTWAVFASRGGGQRPDHSTRYRALAKLTCSEECGEALLVVEGLLSC